MNYKGHELKEITELKADLQATTEDLEHYKGIVDTWFKKYCESQNEVESLKKKLHDAEELKKQYVQTIQELAAKQPPLQGVNTVAELATRDLETMSNMSAEIHELKKKVYDAEMRVDLA